MIYTGEIDKVNRLIDRLDTQDRERERGMINVSCIRDMTRNIYLRKYIQHNTCIHIYKLRGYTLNVRER